MATACTRCDADADGQLNRKEWHSLFKLLHIEASQSDANILFDVLQPDGVDPAATHLAFDKLPTRLVASVWRIRHRGRPESVGQSRSSVQLPALGSSTTSLQHTPLRRQKSSHGAYWDFLDLHPKEELALHKGRSMPPSPLFFRGWESSIFAHSRVSTAAARPHSQYEPVPQRGWDATCPPGMAPLDIMLADSDHRRKAGGGSIWAINW